MLYIKSTPPKKIKSFNKNEEKALNCFSTMQELYGFINKIISFAQEEASNTGQEERVTEESYKESLKENLPESAHEAVNSQKFNTTAPLAANAEANKGGYHGRTRYGKAADDTVSHVDYMEFTPVKGISNEDAKRYARGLAIHNRAFNRGKQNALPSTEQNDKAVNSIESDMVKRPRAYRTFGPSPRVTGGNIPNHEMKRAINWYKQQTPQVRGGLAYNNTNNYNSLA